MAVFLARGRLGRDSRITQIKSMASPHHICNLSSWWNVRWGEREKGICFDFWPPSEGALRGVLAGVWRTLALAKDPRGGGDKDPLTASMPTRVFSQNTASDYSTHPPTTSELCPVKTPSYTTLRVTLNLTLPILRRLLYKAQGRKDFWKPS